jgi:ATP-dependent RNA helicase DeaD
MIPAESVLENPAQPTPAAEPAARFDELGLSATMMEALAHAGYQQPTPIQAGLIPRALAGVDVLGQARTGTGKTAAFVIPILEGLAPRKEVHGPQALVLVPTRELAVQVEGEVLKLSHGRRVHSVAIYGGKPIRGQIDKLSKGAEVIVGTPGRILDHIGRGTLELRNLKFVVLDEADRMLDIGFRPDIEKILRRCPQSRQTLLLSATVPPPVERLAQRYMRDPETLNFSPRDISVETIEQFYFTVDPERKFDLLVALMKRDEPKQAIVFCRTKRGTDRVHRQLSRKIKEVECIHGDLAQNVRDRVMKAFREGKVRYLVATDVVGRGIDVSGISHIINYDIPQFCDDYVHRVGRTGRMGREGVAYTFVSPEEGNELTRIEMRIDRLLKRDELPGFESARKSTPVRPTAAPTDGPAAESGEATEPAAPPPPKPKVPGFGRPVRRIRRAL